MNVIALTWLKYNGQWHEAGKAFEIAESDADMLNGMVTVTNEPEQPPKRRGRPKTDKTEEE